VIDAGTAGAARMPAVASTMTDSAGIAGVTVGTVETPFTRCW